MSAAVNISAIDAVILGKLYDRPLWSRSLQTVKPRVDKLVASGLCKRIEPPTGTAHNMIAITPKDEEVIEAHWSAERARRR